MASNMSLKALLEKAFEPLRAFAERVDAQMERKQLTPALAGATPGGSVPLKRATTSALSLTGSAPPPVASGPARGDKFESSARRPATAAARGTQRTATAAPARPATPPPVPVQAAPVATTLIEGPGGEYFKLPATSRFNAQVSTQAPDTAAVVSRMGATLAIRSEGAVDIRDDAGRTYLSGQVVGVEPDGRVVSLTVNYNLTGQIGQGTLFLGFTDGRLTYLSGSGTGMDDAGRTVVRDLSAVAGKPVAPARPASGTRPIGKSAAAGKTEAAGKSQKLGRR